MIDKSKFDESKVEYTKCKIDELRVWPYTSMISLDVLDAGGDIDDDGDYSRVTKTFSDGTDWYISDEDATLIYKHLVNASWKDDLILNCIMYDGAVATLIIDGKYIPISGDGAFCAIYDIGRKDRK